MSRISAAIERLELQGYTVFFFCAVGPDNTLKVGITPQVRSLDEHLLGVFTRAVENALEKLRVTPLDDLELR